MEKNYRSVLLAKAKKYCKSQNIKTSTLGVRIMNDGNFFKRLESGGGITVDNYLKVSNWFSANLPPKEGA